MQTYSISYLTLLHSTWYARVRMVPRLPCRSCQDDSRCSARAARPTRNREDVKEGRMCLWRVWRGPIQSVFLVRVRAQSCLRKFHIVFFSFAFFCFYLVFFFCSSRPKEAPASFSLSRAMLLMCAVVSVALALFFFFGSRPVYYPFLASSPPLPGVVAGVGAEGVCVCRNACKMPKDSGNFPQKKPQHTHTRSAFAAVLGWGGRG